jgi:hypothetical protein
MASFKGRVLPMTAEVHSTSSAPLDPGFLPYERLPLGEVSGPGRATFSQSKLSLAFGDQPAH